MNILLSWFIATFFAAFLCCAEKATNIAVSPPTMLDSEVSPLTSDRQSDDVPNKLFAAFGLAQQTVQRNKEETTVLAARIGTCSIAINMRRNPSSLKFTSTTTNIESRTLVSLQGGNGYVSLVGHHADVCWAVRFIRECESQHLQNYEVPIPADLLALRLVENIHDLSFTLSHRVPAVNAVIISSSGRLLKVDLFGSILDCSVSV